MTRKYLTCDTVGIENFKSYLDNNHSIDKKLTKYKLDQSILAFRKRYFIFLGEYTKKVKDKDTKKNDILSNNNFNLFGENIQGSKSTNIFIYESIEWISILILSLDKHPLFNREGLLKSQNKMTTHARITEFTEYYSAIFDYVQKLDKNEYLETTIQSYPAYYDSYLLVNGFNQFNALLSQLFSAIEKKGVQTGELVLYLTPYIKGFLLQLSSGNSPFDQLVSPYSKLSDMPIALDEIIMAEILEKYLNDSTLQKNYPRSIYNADKNYIDALTKHSKKYFKERYETVKNTQKWETKKAEILKYWKADIVQNIIASHRKENSSPFYTSFQEKLNLTSPTMKEKLEILREYQLLVKIKEPLLDMKETQKAIHENIHSLNDFLNGDEKKQQINQMNFLGTEDKLKHAEKLRKDKIHALNEEISKHENSLKNLLQNRQQLTESDPLDLFNEELERLEKENDFLDSLDKNKYSTEIDQLFGHFHSSTIS